MSNEIEEDLAEGGAEYDRFAWIASNSLIFRGKNLQAWVEDCAIPEVNSSVSIDELERLNFLAINLLEKVNRNYAYAKSTSDLASLKYQNAYEKAKMDLIGKYSESNTKLPKIDLLDTSVKVQVRDMFSAYKLAELFYEFWKTMQSKVKAFDGRLTSISMLLNMERRNMKYES